MGLDSAWIMPKGKRHPKFKPELRLCGGLFSCFGRGSFRGKVYDGIIRHVAGVSLYQERIPNEIIIQIANSLDNTQFEDLVELYPYEDYNEREHNDLKRMFRKYADSGASLSGWW